MDLPTFMSAPERLTGRSAWNQHIPFAMFLVHALKPEVIVELGTYWGDSYCAFCQAVKESGLISRCYAVDTWKGDSHTGWFGPDVLDDFKAHHDPRYSGFSTLICSTFDKALSHFSDGTVSLLHIDGYHTYEAAKHDFESWLPKVHTQGVVLLHDTNVRERDFGVWRLWDELKARYAHFEFVHGHGLGVMAVGDQHTHRLQRLFNSSGEDRVRIRNSFFNLGWQLDRQIQNATKIEVLQRQLAERIAAADSYTSCLEKRDQVNKALANQLDQKEGSIRELMNQAEEREQVIKSLTDQLHQKDELIREKAGTAQRLQGSLAQQTRVLGELELSLLQQHTSRVYRVLTRYQRLRKTVLRKGNLRNEPAALRESTEALSDAQLIAASGLFDSAWYQRQNPDVAAAGADPLTHFLRRGILEGRDPNPLFDTDWYLQQNPDVADAGLNPVTHYLRWGAHEGRDPSPLFDTDRYRQSNPEVADSAQNPLAHYLRKRVNEGSEPTMSPATPQSRTDSVLKSGLFDPRWYQTRYSDVGAAGIDPLEHFLRYGSAELRSPGPKFDARWYVHEYPEVLSSGLEPLVHYLTIGRNRGLCPAGDSYQTWCRRFDELTEEDRADIRADLAASVLPRLCLLVYIDGATEKVLDQITSAIDRQLASNWLAILILGTDCSPSAAEIAQRTARDSSRYSVLSRLAAPSSLPVIPEGSCVVYVFGGILLREHALYMLARAATSIDGVGLVYSDEDTIDADGNRRNPIFKPQFSPTLARQMDYIGRCFLVRDVNRDPLEIAQQLSDGTVTADQYVDSILTRADTILHVPDVLYHDVSPSRPTLRKSIDLIGPDHALPTFSLIILTRDLVEFLKPCIESIEDQTDYPQSKIEIIVVDNGSSDQGALDYLARLAGDGRAIVLRDAGRFNYSRLNNVAAAAARHDVLLFMNNDMLVDDPLWLRRIATHVLERGVAAVGSRLLFPDRRIQHAGVTLGIRGVAGHNLVGLDETDPRARRDVTRELSAVTGACLAVRRDVFSDLGGFDTTAAVAFNDVLLCLTAMKAGYRNMYIKEPLLIHYESSSRGQDDTPRKVALFAREARYALKRYPELFKNDPYYSPNLCLQEPNELAFPPRHSKSWRMRRRDSGRLKLLFLSSTHEIGHGVAVVLRLQANHLRARGHDVFVGGPKGQAEVPYSDCRRLHLTTPAEAAAVAVELGIDCIIAETPPFFSVTRWLDQSPRTLFLDYGEPPAELFPDAAARRNIALEKQLCFATASKVAAISPSVRAEGTEERAQIIPLGNSHLIGLTDGWQQRRESMRQRLGWVGKAVILNVCRFTAAERHYKGLDRYEEILQEFRFARPQLAARTVFALCGKANPEDVRAMNQCGFEVFPNVSDADMARLYYAVDIYANFSRWEGYNLGIGQALAVGLPVVASDTPAHRAFSVFTSDDTLTIVERLSELVKTAIKNDFSGERIPIVWDWKDSLEILENEIVELCRV